jgi:hypothetical protein
VKRETGTYTTTTLAGEAVRALVPYPSSPARPPLALNAALVDRLTAASAALDRLALAGAMVPSADWFVCGFVRKEAVFSSQIEGTQATLQDVLTYEATEQAPRLDDVREVCNYVAALTYARQQLATPRGLPLSVRLICEAHRRLMATQLKVNWAAALNRLLPQCHPTWRQWVGQTADVGYYWSIQESKRATDVMFRDAGSLAALYPHLIRHATTHLGSRDMLRFLGRRVTECMASSGARWSATCDSDPRVCGSSTGSTETRSRCTTSRIRCCESRPR